MGGKWHPREHDETKYNRRFKNNYGVFISFSSFATISFCLFILFVLRLIVLDLRFFTIVMNSIGYWDCIV